MYRTEADLGVFGKVSWGPCEKYVFPLGFGSAIFFFISIVAYSIASRFKENQVIGPAKNVPIAKPVPMATALTVEKNCLKAVTPTVHFVVNK
jgi:hypothetical protein